MIFILIICKKTPNFPMCEKNGVLIIFYMCIYMIDIDILYHVQYYSKVIIFVFQELDGAQNTPPEHFQPELFSRILSFLSSPLQLPILSALHSS